MSVKQPVMDQSQHQRACDLLQNYRDGGMSHVRQMHPTMSDTEALFEFLKQVVNENTELWTELTRLGANPHTVSLANLVPPNVGNNVVELRPEPAPLTRLVTEWEELDAATQADAEKLISRGYKLDALKLIRERTGTGLKEAKDIVDTRSEQLPRKPWTPMKSSATPTGAVSREEFDQLANMVRGMTERLQHLFEQASGTSNVSLAEKVPPKEWLDKPLTSRSQERPTQPPKEARPATPVEKPPVTHAPPAEASIPDAPSKSESKRLSAQIGRIKGDEVRKITEKDKAKKLTMPGVSVATAEGKIKLAGDWMNTVELFKLLGGGNDPRNDGSKVSFRGKQLVYKSFRQQTPEMFAEGGLEVDLKRKDAGEPWLRVKDTAKVGIK